MVDTASIVNGSQPPLDGAKSTRRLTGETGDAPALSAAKQVRTFRQSLESSTDLSKINEAVPQKEGSIRKRDLRAFGVNLANAAGVDTKAGVDRILGPVVTEFGLEDFRPELQNCSPNRSAHPTEVLLPSAIMQPKQKMREEEIKEGTLKRNSELKKQAAEVKPPSTSASQSPAIISELEPSARAKLNIHLDVTATAGQSTALGTGRSAAEKHLPFVPLSSQRKGQKLKGEIEDVKAGPLTALEARSKIEGDKNKNEFLQPLVQDSSNSGGLVSGEPGGFNQRELPTTLDPSMHMLSKYQEGKGSTVQPEQDHLTEILSNESKQGLAVRSTINPDAPVHRKNAAKEGDAETHKLDSQGVVRHEESSSKSLAVDAPALVGKVVRGTQHEAADYAGVMQTIGIVATHSAHIPAESALRDRHAGELASPLGLTKTTIEPAEMKTLLATPSVLEVGVANGANGWLRLRAEFDHSGEVTATLLAPSESAAQKLHRELPEISAYLANERVDIASLLVSSSPRERMAHEAAQTEGTVATGASFAGREQGRHSEREIRSERGSVDDSDSGMNRLGALLPNQQISATFHRSSSGSWLSVLA